ncbi:MAG: uncharacterized protein A8A55_1126 [Amphiamblys sp. WSBS2006]|nr:MAG: uncharacterized protein A8A55_1126 [Amphiamblys sp. WSBS2006]
MPKETKKKQTKEKSKTEKKPRVSSAYNFYMKEELARVKAKTPEISHRDAFRKAAENWASATENPKNKR